MESKVKLQVGICDDEKIMLEKLKCLVSVCLDELQVSYDLVCCESGEQVIKEAENLDIVFLDIAMPKMDGIDAGKRINKINRDCAIIIASSMVERFKETYYINAFRFITKPYEKEEIYEALEALLKIKIGFQTVEVYRERKKYNIRQRKIKYIVSYDGYVELKAGDYIFRKESSLSEMERCLCDKIFFRIHKQYLINMLWIDEYKNNYITIEGMEFSISRRKRGEFNKKYLDFDINYR